MSARYVNPRYKAAVHFIITNYSSLRYTRRNVKCIVYVSICRCVYDALYNIKRRFLFCTCPEHSPDFFLFIPQLIFSRTDRASACSNHILSKNFINYPVLIPTITGTSKITDTMARSERLTEHFNSQMR